MHEGSCHCGAVRMTLPSTPEVATDCNCSLCRRIGGPWVYFESGTVKIEGHPAATAEYIWGDRTLRTLHCKTCGCVTHWEALQPTPRQKHGVNLGNFAPELIAAVRVRQFDGADTWRFIDEPAGEEIPLDEGQRPLAGAPTEPGPLRIVFLATSSRGLEQARQLARPTGSPIWCGADALPASEHRALQGTGITRFEHSLQNATAEDLRCALATLKEHHPGATVWAEQPGTN